MQQPRTEKTPPTIVFDFDGTLCDSLSLFFESLNIGLAKIGRAPIPLDELELLRGLSARELLQFLRIPLLRLPLLRFHAKRALLARSGTLELFEGIPNAIRRLQALGWTLGILSSNHHGTITEVLRRHDLDRFAFVVSNSGVFTKHRLLRRMLKGRRLGARGDSVVYVGDEARDIEACHAVGIPCLAVTWGYNNEARLLKQRPSACVHSPSDLEHALQNILQS